MYFATMLISKIKEIIKKSLWRFWILFKFI